MSNRGDTPKEGVSNKGGGSNPNYPSKTGNRSGGNRGNTPRRK